MKPIRLIATTVLAMGLWPAHAQAQISRVFVSVTGNDGNDCLQPAAACRTLNGGIAKVDAQGEVIVINTGSFAGASITKSVKINVPSGAIAFSSSSIVINAPGATVVVRGLTLKAFTPGSGAGIDIQAAASVLVENCVMDGWANGIQVSASAGAVKVDVKDTTLRNNSTDGLRVDAVGAVITVDQSRFERNLDAGMNLFVAANATVTRSFFTGNTFGVGAQGGVTNISRSTVAGSSQGGVFVFGGTTRVSESLISGNGTGLQNGGGTLESFEDNILFSNTANTSGAITAVTRQ